MSWCVANVSNNIMYAFRSENAFRNCRQEEPWHAKSISMTSIHFNALDTYWSLETILTNKVLALTAVNACATVANEVCFFLLQPRP